MTDVFHQLGGDHFTTYTRVKHHRVDLEYIQCHQLNLRIDKQTKREKVREQLCQDENQKFILDSVNRENHDLPL